MHQRYSEEADHRLYPETAPLGSLQMVKFAQSLKAYASGAEPPEGCYPGEWTKQLAESLAETVPLDAPLWIWGKFGGTRVTKSQADDLAVFGVTFDTWSRESELHNPANKTLRALHVSGTLPFTLSNGKQVCGECGHLQKEFEPCSFCTGDLSFVGVGREVTDAIIAHNLQKTDPGLHPDNDFMSD